MAKNDWCHFSLRLKRSKYHKYVKDSQLGYEDEKYSYLIISKEPSKKYISRVLRHPIRTKGNVELVLCKSGMALKENVTKKEKEKYKIAKKIKWGDIFEYET
jgi:ribosomal protein RSM22 (predicted rRNA methylase)